MPTCFIKLASTFIQLTVLYLVSVSKEMAHPVDTKKAFGLDKKRYLGLTRKDIWVVKKRYLGLTRKDI